MRRDRRAGADLNRPIKGEWPYVWLDATYVKARRDHHIVSVAVIVAVGVNTDGRREVLGMAVGHSEAEPFWVDFLRQLARRGRRGAKLVKPGHDLDPARIEAVRGGILGDDRDPRRRSLIPRPVRKAVLRDENLTLSGDPADLTGPIPPGTKVPSLSRNGAPAVRLVALRQQATAASTMLYPS